MNDIATKLTTIAENQQKVYDAGKQAEYDAFWDRFQLNDGITNNGGVYPYSFCYWDMANFKPKVDIHLCPGFYDCTMMFAYTSVYSFEDKTNKPYSLVELLNKYGVKLKTTGYTNFLQMFYYSKVTEVPSIDISSATVIGNMFYNCGSLTTIEELIVSKTTPVLNCFTSCVSLENITIKGVIGKSGAIFPSTKLSKASITSIINALSPDVTGKITFRQTAVQKAFANAAQDWSALINDKPSWTIALQ